LQERVLELIKIEEVNCMHFHQTHIHILTPASIFQQYHPQTSIETETLLEEEKTKSFAGSCISANPHRLEMKICPILAKIHLRPAVPLNHFWQYLFIGTRNFHYCENYEPQKTVFFL
jgi:hypothetical protein